MKRTTLAVRKESKLDRKHFFTNNIQPPPTAIRVFLDFCARVNELGKSDYRGRERDLNTNLGLGQARRGEREGVFQLSSQEAIVVDVIRAGEMMGRGREN